MANLHDAERIIIEDAKEFRELFNIEPAVNGGSGRDYRRDSSPPRRNGGGGGGGWTHSNDSDFCRGRGGGNWTQKEERSGYSNRVDSGPRGGWTDPVDYGQRGGSSKFDDGYPRENFSSNQNFSKPDDAAGSSWTRMDNKSTNRAREWGKIIEKHLSPRGEGSELQDKKFSGSPPVPHFSNLKSEDWTKPQSKIETEWTERNPKNDSNIAKGSVNSEIEKYLPDFKWSNGKEKISHYFMNIGAERYMDETKRLLESFSSFYNIIIICPDDGKMDCFVEDFKKQGIWIVPMRELSQAKLHDSFRPIAINILMLAKYIDHLDGKIFINFDLNMETVNFLERFIRYKNTQDNGKSSSSTAASEIFHICINDEEIPLLDEIRIQFQ